MVVGVIEADLLGFQALGHDPALLGNGAHHFYEPVFLV